MEAPRQRVSEAEKQRLQKSRESREAKAAKKRQRQSKNKAKKKSEAAAEGSGANAVANTAAGGNGRVGSPALPDARRVQLAAILAVAALILSYVFGVFAAF